jgi:glycosyltransferase involved in cell wall biosynthesis
VIALTNSEKQILIDLGVKPEKIFITGIGPLIADTSDPEEFRQQYSLGDDPIILFLGQKYQYKGFQVLLSGAQQVWKKLPDVRFVFIGPRTDYSEKVFAEVNDPRVLELGKVSLEEKTNALAACDILCVPSMQESFGGIYTEGWIMKKPVIGGDIPAIRDVIDDGLNGFLVQQDAGQMAEKNMPIN